MSMEENIAYMTREEDISYDFIGNDRIWPPYIPSNPSHPFMKALIEVLKRLPEDDYAQVAAQVTFVVEDLKFTAFNVPFERFYPPTHNELQVRFDTIVIFHPALDYPHKALMGLIAHEIAHSFVDNKLDYKTNEQETDLQARQWGFGIELETLQEEKDKKGNHSKI